MLSQQNNLALTEPNKENDANLVSQMTSRSVKSQDFYGRCDSQASSQSSTNTEICRICHCEGDTDTSLIAPCYCAGSLRYVHQVCLQQWIKSSNIRCCELCKFQFIMHTKTKPFMEWEPLEMTGFERRKLLCAVMFHTIALTCVVWSLYVLIDRTAEEIKHGLLEWPFWTKLIVVAIGFTGGVVFMYIQCKAYMQICQRWKAFNRVIYVQNAPEKQPLPAAPPVVIVKSNNSGGAEGSKVDLKLCEGGNFTEETSIDLKGVRNLHIFFNDENRVCVQNEQLCSNDEGEGSSEAGGVVSNSQRNDDLGASWHIKIGKGSGNEGTSNTPFRGADSECALISSDQFEQCRTTKSNEDYTIQKYNDSATTNKGDSVLKLQIKKAEIVIKFGQKTSGETSSEENQNVENKDASVNIKIDDKESEPIVIDLVKKTPIEPKDPVQIRFDFMQNDLEKSCDSDESINGSDTKLLESGGRSEAFGHSETDSGSQSPLLSKTNSAQFYEN